MIRWSCCFHDKYEGLTNGKDVTIDIRWEGGHGEVPSINEYTPGLKEKVLSVSSNTRSWY